MLSAIRLGPLAVASVLGSLYPVATVLLARAILGEHLRGLQRVGVGLALAAVILAAWP
jgi:drug/metabolite transporter (DMT)-like permease